MATTMLTLANGRTVDVRGSYEEVTTTLAPRKMVQDTGVRELTRSDGRRLTVSLGGILAVEEAAEKRQRRIGFQ